MIRRHVFCGALALAALSAAAHADPVDMAKAKQEGSVSWYTSTPINAAQKLSDLFTKETGIKVELFRSGGEAVLRRLMQEISAGRFAADVITTSDPAATAELADKGLFVSFKPANFDKVPAEVKDMQGRFIAQRLNMLGIIARADKVAAADRPKRWADLVKPAYKGKMVMPDPSFASLQLVVVATLSQKLGWDFYKGLRKNDVMVVQGHQQVADMLKSGERLIAAEGADSYAFEDRKAGHDELTIFPAEGAFAVPAPTAIVKGGPHPEAAKALAQFMLSDAAQGLFPEIGLYGSRADAPPPKGNPKLADVKLMPVDYVAIEKSAAEVKERFAEIFQ